MNGIPPEGVYVIISSDTVTVTNQQPIVGIGTAEEDGSASGGGSDD